MNLRFPLSFIVSIFLIFASSGILSGKEARPPQNTLNLILPFDWLQIEPFAGGIFAAKDYHNSASVLVVRRELPEGSEVEASNREFQTGVIEAVRGRNGRIIEAGDVKLANHSAFRIYFKDKGSNLHTLSFTLFDGNIMYGIIFFCMGEDPSLRYDVQKILKKAYFRVDA
ncbi:hypothetical protein ACE5IS_04195 [Leptospira wolffii]|uniref:PsbP C-terminal domain-containing protein n=1 Tax=Leptospira wolffii TaxID=409998 RepID=A0ABV5BL55_9LEPT|nr:hypothetical protein [Leptospira wolffii]TGL46523.1 hypothetical protein EHQ61_17410 [Leptospira wolffii]